MHQTPRFRKAIATRKIIADAAAAAGIKVELEELQQAADNLRLAHKLLQASDTWAWLQKHHLTLDELEQLAYTNVGFRSHFTPNSQAYSDSKRSTPDLG